MTISTDSQLHPRVLDLLFIALWRLLPDSLVNILSRIPSKETYRMLNFKSVAKRIARKIFKNQLTVASNGKNTKDKDIVNILGETAL